MILMVPECCGRLNERHPQNKKKADIAVVSSLFDSVATLHAIDRVVRLEAVKIIHHASIMDRVRPNIGCAARLMIDEV